jgi:hypothetical protein
MTGVARADVTERKASIAAVTNDFIVVPSLASENRVRFPSSGEFLMASPAPGPIMVTTSLGGATKKILNFPIFFGAAGPSSDSARRYARA